MEPSDKKCLFSGLIGVKEFEKYLSSRGKNRYVPVFPGCKPPRTKNHSRKRELQETQKNLAPWRKQLTDSSLHVSCLHDREADVAMPILCAVGTDRPKSWVGIG